MADGIVEGLTKIVSGTEEKGTKAVGNKDMDNLMVQVINADNAPIPIKLIQQKATVAKNPTEADLIKNAGDLYVSVPAGFLLLHGDLQKILDAIAAISEGKKGGGSGGSLDMMKAGAVAGVVSGALTGVVQGLAGIFKSDKTTKHMQGIIEELTLETTADDYRDNPEVQAQIKQGFIDYLGAYFREQRVALYTSGTLAAVGKGAGEAVAGVLTGLFAGFGLKKKNPLEQIVDDIMAQETSDKYIGDPEVEEATRNGIIGYLKTWFVSQTIAMSTDTILAGIGDSAGSAVAGVLKGVFSLGFAPKSYQRIQNIVNDIVDVQTADKYLGDAEVEEAVHDGIVGYLKTYMAMQTASMATDTVFAMTGEAAGSYISSTLSNLFTLGFKKKSYDNIQRIVDDIVNAEDSSEYIGAPDVKEATRKGVIGYLKTYFVSQSAAMATDNTMAGIGSGAGDLVMKTLTGIFTLGLGGTKTKSYAKIQTIIDDIMAEETSDKYIGDRDVKTTVKDGIIGYLKTYFITQTTAMATDAILSGVGSAAGDLVGNVLRGVFSFGLASTKSYSKIQNIVDDIIEAQTSENYLGDSKVEDAVRNGIVGYLKTYFITQTTAMALDSTVSGVVNAATGAVGSLLKGIFSLGFAPKSYQKIQNIVDDIMDAQVSDTFIKDSKVEDVVKNGVIGYLKTYFVTQAAAMATDNVVGGVGQAAGSVVSGLLKNVFTLGFAPKSYQKIQDIVDTVINAQSESKFLDDKIVKEAVSKGIGDYIEIYFKTQAINMATSESEVSKSVNSKGKLIQLLSGITEQPTDEKTYSKIQSIVDTVIKAQSEGNFVDDDTVKKAVREGIGEYVKMYFEIQAKNMEATEIAKGQGDRVKNFANKLFGGIFSKKEESAEDSKFTTTIAALTEDVNATEFRDTDEVKKARNEGIAAAITAILNVESEAVQKNYKTGIDKNKVKTGFAGTSDAYIAATKKAIVFTEDDYQSEKIRESRQKGLSDLLDTFFAETNRFIEIPHTTDFEETAQNLNAKIKTILENTEFDDSSSVTSAFYDKVQDSINKLEINLTVPDSIDLTDKLDSEKVAGAFTDKVVEAINELNISQTISDSFSAEVSNSSDAEIETVAVLNDISNLLVKLSATIETIKENGPGFAYINTAGSGVEDPGLG